MIVKDAVYQHVSRVTRVPISELDDQSAAINVPTWDSLSHIMLIVALEETFGIRFGLCDITDMKNLGELVARVEELWKSPSK